MHDAIETDALIVGAGPVGLFQVFECGLLDMKAHIVDSLPQPGGQCVELYADKPIYDVPGIAVCTGRELIERLLEQISPLGATFHLGQEVTHVAPRDDDRFDVRTSAGQAFIARSIFVAGGVGSFQPRALKIDGIESLAAGQLLYRVEATQRFADEDVLVFGDGQDAVDCAVDLATARQQGGGPRSVAIVHRRDSFRADAESTARMRALVSAGALALVIGQAVSCRSADGRLTGIDWVDSEGLTHASPASRLIVRLGLSPKLGPVAQWGLGVERKLVPVNTESFETQVPGIFAVGDINHYPGKRKLLLCGFHEATLAAFGAAQRMRPGERIALQYTTTSPHLHRVLGVETPPSDR